MEILCKTPQATKELAERVAKNLKPYNVLALYGDLGSGKTTFTRYLVEALNIDARVQSPTFVLLRKYFSFSSVNKIQGVYHLDLYRMQNVQELDELCLPELFSTDSFITIIEWPELAESLLPSNVIKIYFEYNNEFERKITLVNYENFN